MVDGKASPVAGQEYEGGAAGSLLDIEAPGDALGEASFARAKGAGKEEEVAGLGVGPDGAPDVVGLVGAPAGYAKTGGHLTVVVPPGLAGGNVFSVFVQHRHVAGLTVGNPPDDGGLGDPVDDPVHDVRRRGE